MTLQSIKYKPGKLEILDQLQLPSVTKYVQVNGVEDGWKVINKMQVRNYFIIAVIIYLPFWVVSFDQITIVVRHPPMTCRLLFIKTNYQHAGTIQIIVILL